MCNGNSNGCVCDVVKFIDALQKQVKPCPRHEGCDRPRLGGPTNVPRKFNTRPFILYLQNGNLFRAFTGTDGQSPFFRVEEVDNCCAKCRVLEQVSEGSINDVKCGRTRLKGTDEFVVIDLGCCCGIQCLDDTFIKC